jgi:hypothetical protein
MTFTSKIVTAAVGGENNTERICRIQMTKTDAKKRHESFLGTSSDEAH